jgi:hypothetical protein
VHCQYIKHYDVSSQMIKITLFVLLQFLWKFTRKCTCEFHFVVKNHRFLRNCVGKLNNLRCQTFVHSRVNIWPYNTSSHANKNKIKSCLLKRSQLVWKTTTLFLPLLNRLASPTPNWHAINVNCSTFLLDLNRVLCIAVSEQLTLILNITLGSNAWPSGNHKVKQAMLTIRNLYVYH